MNSFWTDLAATLLIFAAQIAAFIGWGSLGRRWLGIGFRFTERPWSQFWLGWVLSMVFLEVWHLALPVDYRTTAVVYGGGLAALLWSRWRHRKALCWKPCLGTAIFSMLLVVVAVWVALRSFRVPGVSDTGLYYLGTIRWLNEYAIVPGLGNLHDRLAFNQFTFLYAASLNAYPFFHHGYSVAVSLLYLVVLTESLFCVRRLFGKQGHRRTVDLLPVLWLPFLLYYGALTSLSSPASDATSFLFQIVLMRQFWGLLEFSRCRRLRLFRMRFVIVLVAAAVCVKLSNVCYAGLIFVIGLFVCCRAAQTSRSATLKRLLPVTVCATFFLLLWMGRGLVLSGYPLYPSHHFAISADWTVPESVARDQTKWIASWARQPFADADVVLRDNAWLKPWFHSILQRRMEVVHPTVLALLAGVSVLLVWFKRLRGNESGLRVQTWLAIVPVLGGLLFWFKIAPDPRFANALFWMLPVCLFGVLLMLTLDTRHGRKVLLLSLVLLSLPEARWFMVLPATAVDVSWTGWEPLPQVPLETKITQSGLKVFVPATGDRTWDAPLPATPYFNPKLRLRGTSFQEGFSVQENVAPVSGK